MTCGICYGDTSKNVTCPSCAYIACATCVQTYFASQEEPNCASCHVKFTREFLSRELPSFLKTFKQMREKYLLDREMALMPGTQPAVASERRKRQAMEEEEPLKKRLKEVIAEEKALKAKLRNLDQIIRHPETAAATGAAASASTTREHQDEVVCKCPVGDCRGFVTKLAFKCGLCDTAVCKTCMMQEFEGHACKKEDVESAQLVKKSSKPCPKCAAPIFKIDGCDQMWCTQCKTAFSWRTGMIDEGKVHNPHFYEWQRQLHNGEAPRVEGDVPPHCAGQELTYGSLLRLMPRSQSLLTKRIGQMHQYMRHLEGTERPPPPIDNTGLRVKYLLGDFDEKRLATRLQQVEKLFQKNTEVYQVHQTVVEACKVIFQDMVTESRVFPLSEEQLPKFVDRFEELLRFANVQMREIKDKYQMLTPRVDPDDIFR